MEKSVKFSCSVCADGRTDGRTTVKQYAPDSRSEGIKLYENGV